MGLEFSRAPVYLEAVYGSNPQLVGRADGTEDDWGDLISEAVTQLGRSVDELDDECWQHVQAVAANCQATNMAAFLSHIGAALEQC